MSEAPAARAAAGLGARLIALVAAMRAGGARVGVGELLAAHRALGAVDPASRRDAYFALRAALCSRRGDLAVFDAAFGACFGAPAAPDPPEPLDEAAALALPRVAMPLRERQAPADAPPPVPRPAAAGEEELLGAKDFADYTDAERALARRLIARLAERGPRRRSRRTRPARRRGEAHPPAARHDLRRTVRASLRYGGEPVERRWRERADRARPVVLVCDVSGSMAPYARMLLQYLQACVAARRRVEAFAFATRLTRITRELAGRDPDRALARASAAVVDIAGGTRIGAALAELNRVHGRRLGRGAAVVVLSDGWDLGEPEALADEMARLRRCAHRVVWLNPLKASPDYEPLTRGMTAALPHVDHFMAGNSIDSLTELARLLEDEM